ncbi:MAG: methyltransferase [Candidatus Aenigmarchaeota archaeon]|nr:methyltransferase [Candidatus Aenigmarchaeota archaeon]
MKFFYRSLELTIPETVYDPSEDSLLLADLLEREDLAQKDVLDMGCGSGLLSILCAAKHAQVTAVDVNPKAVQATKENAKKNHVPVMVLQSDLFSRVHGTFDLILFNAPYLPTAPDDDDARWSGGENGRDAIERFAATAMPFLKPSGKILLAISSLTGEQEVTSLFEQQNFSIRVATRQKIAWEELIVIECRTDAF